jgi:hypothetical protein
MESSSIGFVWWVHHNWCGGGSSGDGDDQNHHTQTQSHCRFIRGISGAFIILHTKGIGNI